MPVLYANSLLKRNLLLFIKKKESVVKWILLLKRFAVKFLFEYISAHRISETEVMVGEFFKYFYGIGVIDAHCFPCIGYENRFELKLLSIIQDIFNVMFLLF